MAFPGAREAREATADSLFAQFLVRGIASLKWTPVDSLTAQKRLIEAGFGLALLPESAIREERGSGSLATIEVADLRAANPVFAIVRKGGFLSPAARDLVALLKSQPLARARRGRKRT